MMDLIHGGDIYSHKNIKVDFSSNLNPFGLPDSIKKAIVDSIDAYASYPDILCRALCSSLSEYENIDSSNIICGNGAADLIYRIVYGLKPKRALLLAPTFAEYAEALHNVDAKITYHHLDAETFTLDHSILDKIKNADIFFICNPNNPTGSLIYPGLMKLILTAAEESNCILVVDECFSDFLEKQEENTMKKYVTKYENLIIIKAFTKIYAMAGIRLGYLLLSNQILKGKIFHAGQSWSVSTVAQKCGIAAIQEKNYVEKTKRLVIEQRFILERELRNFGFTVFSSQVNYILFYTETYNLFDKLLDQGILIRDCKNYVGLKKGFYRIAVRLEEENVFFLESVKKYLAVFK